MAKKQLKELEECKIYGLRYNYKCMQARQRISEYEFIEETANREQPVPLYNWLHNVIVVHK